MLVDGLCEDHMLKNQFFGELYRWIEFLVIIDSILFIEIKIFEK